MKRTIALLLALLLMFSTAIPAAADNGESPPPEEAATPAPEATASPAPEETATPAPEETTAPAPEETTAPAPGETTAPAPEATATPAPEETAAPAPEATATPAPDEPAFAMISQLAVATGTVDISITEATDLGQWEPSFRVALSGHADHSFEGLPADGTRHSFSGLAAGEYTLTVSAPGFVTYTQPVTVDASDGIFLQLTIGQRLGYTDGAHPGILQIGDVDGDGDLDQTDKELIMQAAAGAAVGSFTDFNGDGVTDLADAEYLAKGADIGALAENARLATEEHFIPQTAVEISQQKGTLTTGVESLFQDNGVAFQMSKEDGQAITPEAPVAVSFDMADNAKSDVILLEDTNILSGTIEIEYSDDTKAVVPIGTAPVPVAAAAPVPVTEVTETFPAVEAAPEPAAELPQAEPSEADTVPAPDDPTFAMIDPLEVPGAEYPAPEVVQEGGNIQVDLKGQKAVKRVTLTVTSTVDNSSLAEISQVEFVNGMESRIKEPELDVPQNVAAQAGSRQFTVSWTACVNTTGYVAEITADGMPGVKDVVPLTGTSLTVTNFNGKEAVNYTTYHVQVRSVNGSWESPLSDMVSVAPRPTAPPDKPDNVKAEGGYQTVTVTWKNMKDTTAYDLFYKVASGKDYTKVPDLTGTSYTITGLNSQQTTVYEVYLVGKNEHGDSAPSLHASAATITLDPPDMPRFNLINRDGDGTPGAYHIQSAARSGGKLVDSRMDTADGTAWATVDGAPGSYYYKATWDDGGFNNLHANCGLVYTFDGFYEMDTIAVMAPGGMNYGYAKVRWWDENGQDTVTSLGAVAVETRKDAQNRTYFLLRLPEPIRTNKIQLGLSRAWVRNEISVAEVYFYKYDDLKREIMALYADDLHTTLQDTVTEDGLNQLKARIESSADEFGEPNPEKAQLLKEWETAWQIFHEQFTSRVIRVHDGITAAGDEHGFGGLNAWQPLGVTAAAGETVTVYVGHGSKRTGDKTGLQLVATQYDAEANAMSKVLTDLKVGANEIQIPKIWTTTGVESGGSLYVQYTGGAGTGDSYAVRVSGGVRTPVLDLYHVQDQSERLNRVNEYIAELSAYVGSLQATHAERHQGENAASTEVDYAFDNTTCILGACDIMLDTMMLSLPAQQILAGCGGDAYKLLNSMTAMENMMTLFYQHKGLNANAADAADRIPNRHLNIRYQRMFSGAFMYASGDHIGIGWNETAGMTGCGGVQADGNGLYTGGNYFGWGIAHEIGHDINQSSYAIAEITNNYFAVLAQAQDTNDSVRFLYPNVYEKVTSGTKGSAGNVFTQLGMYWQLHLAYDTGYNFRTYADYEQQLANLFYARVDTYARKPEKAPAPNGVALTLAGADVDQTIMRLACAAAQRNLLDFFQRWGKTPDETTVAYASQFEAETRAIYYVCDDSRRYTMEHGGPSKLAADGSTEAIASVTAAVDPEQKNKINISITPSETVPAEEILGYEIVRCTVAKGQVERRTVGFTTESAFSDVVQAMNNRAVYYEVTLVDQYLNRSRIAATGTAKIQHEGDLDKTSWTVATAGLKADPIVTNGYKDDNGNVLDPEIVREDASKLLVDNKTDTVYTAQAEQAGPVIEIDFHDTQIVAGFRYTAGTGVALGGYSVDVRQNGEWVRAGEGTLAGSTTVYFSNTDGKYVSTYAADALRLNLTAQPGGTVSAAEVDVLGPTGDNVDFRYADGTAAIGYLTEDFTYGDEPEDVIPAGSLVFTGTYAGNAAYNVVMLYDECGRMVAGTAPDGAFRAYQTIMADLPETGAIENVRNGTWIYWVQKEDLAGLTMPQQVRAELYRVNNAQTNEGERLVSDSLFVPMPQQPGTITLGGVG